MVQSENSIPHVSKNTNKLTLKICVEYFLDTYKHLAHNSYTNSRAKNRRIAVVLVQVRFFMPTTSLRDPDRQVLFIAPLIEDHQSGT